MRLKCHYIPDLKKLWLYGFAVVLRLCVCVRLWLSGQLPLVKVSCLSTNQFKTSLEKMRRVGAEGNESLTRTVGLAVSLCQSAIREPCQLYTNTESLKCNDFPQATSASPWALIQTTKYPIRHPLFWQPDFVARWEIGHNERQLKGGYCVQSWYTRLLVLRIN